MSSAQVARQERVRKSSPEGFTGIFLAVFIVFLFVALFCVVCTLDWRTFLPGAEGAKSVFGGVKSAAYTAISLLI